jgi:hypothetical protein
MLDRPISALDSAPAVTNGSSSLSQEPVQVPKSTRINVDTIVSHSSCCDTLWSSLCNFFAKIWNYLCCKPQKQSSLSFNPTEPSNLFFELREQSNPTQELNPLVNSVNNTGRNWADSMLKTRFESTETTPSYEGLGQLSLLVSPYNRHLYVEFLLELIDVEYEPKRASISPETIKVFIRKIALSTEQETLLLGLCDRDNYTALGQKLQELESLLNPTNEFSESKDSITE